MSRIAFFMSFFNLRKTFSQYTGTHGIIERSVLEKFRMVASLGFEPKQADPESAVLPLHHEAIRDTSFPSKRERDNTESG